MKRPLFALAIAIGLPASLAAQTSARPDSAPSLPSVTLPSELDRVLRDYERAWQAGDAVALAALFADDGFLLQPGRPPIRGRAEIEARYRSQAGGPLKLRPLAYSTGETSGYIIGAYGYGDASNDMGKFTLTLRRSPDGRWSIFSDMDNPSQPPRRPPGAVAGRFSHG